MSVQLTYEDNPAAGFKGMLAGNFESPRMMDSALAEGAIKVGNAVEAGAAVGTMKTLAAAANFAGVAVYFAGIEKPHNMGDADELEIADKKQLAVMTRGRVWAVASAAIAKGAEVVPSTDASTKFAAGAGTSKVRAVALTAAAADGDLIEIELVSPVL